MEPERKEPTLPVMNIAEEKDDCEMMKLLLESISKQPAKNIRNLYWFSEGMRMAYELRKNE